jgi:hypothetical protein
VKHRERADLPRPKYRFFSAAAIFSFVFICFFPNPALPVGSNTGLQAGQILIMPFMFAFLALGGLPRRHVLALLLLIFPPFLSGFLAVIAGRALSYEIVLNNMIATLSVMIVLVPAGAMVRKRYMVPLILGSALAILCNSLVGFYQAYWFSKDVFPLSELYQNPSFKSLISDDPSTWALYVKRPFGLFPEPSAMAASTGPWLVLILGLLLYPNLRPWATRGTKTLLALAIVGGVGLIIMSRSGFTVFLLTGFLLVSVPVMRGKVLRLHHPGSLLTVVALVLMGVAITVLSVAYLNTRVGSELQGGSSWPLRFASILLGLKYLGTSLPDLLIGAGPGQSSLVLQSSGVAGSSLGGDTGIAAVWSVVVTYIQEAGLVGVAALATVLGVVLRAVTRSSTPLLGSSCLMVWLGSVVFTTSYLALLPVWIFFALLLGWEYLFDRDSGSVELAPESAVTSLGVSEP